ncbi:potassium-transporting ATPase subunit C [Clostridium cylindrosporum]|uniref:Potassium-transporting ATPase C chain KdpC n=1 Tax=Clostridium cylindrosporum DSM 605 TaxID=1121307 RepID=A0A0J8DF91_CLOCY|nr:potassium-transporting ATPase subunit C [Clostridium cylindrosporum]KMT22843.1 potassium-transporting ATPase C chain KdpC [Clostridium cylindrosporum DSM 605]
MKIFMNSIKVTIIFLILCGVIYPLIGTGVAQVLFNNKANGSIIERNGEKIGSLYLGQEYTKDYYFKGRPKSDEGGAKETPSGKDFKETLKKRVDLINNTYATANIKKGKKFDGIPRDMVTTSASSNDPNISKEAALYQVSYISEKSKISEDKLIKAIENSTENNVGKAYVNLIKLNMEVDKLIK